jgi:succinate dehydrogenase (ubiquinone) membrane anchor subunit
VLAGLTPVAFVLSPSVINMPVDILLGLVFPFHSHVAVNYVISDYVPKANRSMARMALLATSVITVVGLLKLNIQGPGLTETIKSLWKKPEAKK